MKDIIKQLAENQVAKLNAWCEASQHDIHQESIQNKFRTFMADCTKESVDLPSYLPLVATLYLDVADLIRTNAVYASKYYSMPLLSVLREESWRASFISDHRLFLRDRT